MLSGSESGEERELGRPENYFTKNLFSEDYDLEEGSYNISSKSLVESFFSREFFREHIRRVVYESIFSGTHSSAGPSTIAYLVNLLRTSSRGLSTCIQEHHQRGSLRELLQQYSSENSFAGIVYEITIDMGVIENASSKRIFTTKSSVADFRHKSSWCT